MNADKKLLELAAKAADVPLAMINHKWWNPLTDNGDAFCLAVKLNLLINPMPEKPECHVNVYDGGDVDIYEAVIQDQYEATRRAIVRAAAEIGKTL